MNIDSKVALQLYNEKVAELSHEIILLKSYIKQLENKQELDSHTVAKPVE